MYIAAAIHDFDHYGLNNDFLVKSGSELALEYNDFSPLENHHAASAFRALRQPGCNFLEVGVRLADSSLWQFNSYHWFQSWQQLLERKLSMQIALPCTKCQYHGYPDLPNADKLFICDGKRRGRKKHIPLATRLPFWGMLSWPGNCDSILLVFACHLLFGI